MAEGGVWPEKKSLKDCSNNFVPDLLNTASFLFTA